MENNYRKAVERFIKHRAYGWVIVLLCLVLIGVIGKNIQSEVAPLEDKSNINLSVTGPEGASYAYMSEVSEKIGAFLVDSVPENSFVSMNVPSFGSSGSNSARGQLGLVPVTQRQKTQSEIAKELSKKFSRFNDVRIFPIEEQTI